MSLRPGCDRSPSHHDMEFRTTRRLNVKIHSPLISNMFFLVSFKLSVKQLESCIDVIVPGTISSCFFLSLPYRVFPYSRSLILFTLYRFHDASGAVSKLIHLARVSVTFRYTSPLQVTSCYVGF